MRLSNRIALLLLISIIIAFAGCSHSDKDTSITANSTVTISSSAFSNNGSIPVTYAYNSGIFDSNLYMNYSPPIQSSGIPSGTQSVALFVTALEDTSISWVLYMPVSADFSLAANASATGNLPAGSIQGINRLGTTGWAGPAPSSGTYTYIFEVYALNSQLGLSSAPTSADLLNAMGSSIIGYGYYYGKFSKMSMTSTSFPDNGFIPVQYTWPTPTDDFIYSWDYMGNTSPTFTWSNAPSGTKSYILTLEDQYAKVFWVAYNIPATTLTIPEADDNERPVPTGSTYGTNDCANHTQDYHGPDPTPGALVKYYYKLYAINGTLNSASLGHPTKTALFNALTANNLSVLSESVYTGNFIRLELTSTAFASGGQIPGTYRYIDTYSSVNPPLSWNSSGILNMLNAANPPVSMVIMVTKMQEGTPLEDPDEWNWILYIPEVEPDNYSIAQGISWSVHPGNWVQALTYMSQDDVDNWWNRGYDGFELYDTTGTESIYRIGLYVLSTTLGIARDAIMNQTYSTVKEALYANNTTILNKAFLGGYFINTTY